MSSAASHYAKGTVANVVRSLLVVAGMAAVIFLMVARTSSVSGDQADIEAAARQHATQSGHPFEYATDLPEGWTSDSQRYVRSKDDLMMWSATWKTPDGEYVALQQVADATDTWVNTQTNNGKRVGTVSTGDGREWLQREREGKVQRSLVNRGEGEGELTTIVTGTGTFDQLLELANHLETATG